MPTRDLYGLLGVSRRATQDEIRRAYRRLARETHPDANPGDPRAEERFKRIQHAYGVLYDPGKRRAYDEGTRTPSKRAPEGNPARNSGDFSELLNKLDDLFGRAGGRMPREWKYRGENVSIDINFGFGQGRSSDKGRATGGETEDDEEHERGEKGP